jgi:hypothetical protein
MFAEPAAALGASFFAGVFAAGVVEEAEAVAAAGGAGGASSAGAGSAKRAENTKTAGALFMGTLLPRPEGRAEPLV